MRRFVLLAAALLIAMSAYAGMIRPDDAERERVKSLLARPEAAKELERMGVTRQDAQARVDAMTPAEVQELAGRIDVLAAGGQSTQNLLLVIIIILLIIIAL